MTRQKPPMGTWFRAGIGGVTSGWNRAKSFEEVGGRGGMKEREGRIEAT